MSISGGNILMDNATWYSSKNTTGTAIQIFGVAMDNNIYMGDLFGNIPSSNVILRTNGGDKLTITSDGNVGIGTNLTHGYKFAVNGSAIATSMTVQLSANWPDYVFRSNYQLPSLQEVKTYIDQYQHLPEMPSAAEVEKDGLKSGQVGN